MATVPATNVSQLVSQMFMPRGATTIFDLSDLPALASAGASADACLEQCKGLPTIAFQACVSNCQRTGKPFGDSNILGGITEKITGGIRNVLVIVLGIVLVIVAITLITR